MSTRATLVQTARHSLSVGAPSARASYRPPEKDEERFVHVSKFKEAVSNIGFEEIVPEVSENIKSINDVKPPRQKLKCIGRVQTARSSGEVSFKNYWSSLRFEHVQEHTKLKRRQRNMKCQAGDVERELDGSRRFENDGPRTDQSEVSEHTFQQNTEEGTIPDKGRNGNCKMKNKKGKKKKAKKKKCRHTKVKRMTMTVCHCFVIVSVWYVYCCLLGASGTIDTCCFDSACSQ